MSDRYEQFEVTIPTGTLASAPQTTLLTFQEGIVTNIRVRVPPGPSGLVGFMVAYSGQQVIPKTLGTFFIAEDEILNWPIRGFPTGQRWQIRGYNTDIFNHTLYVTLSVDEFPTRPPGAPVIVPIPIGGAPTEEEALAELASEGEQLPYGGDVNVP